MATFLSLLKSFEGKFRCKWIIKFLRILNERYLLFLDFEKVEITEKTEEHLHTASISIRAIFLRYKVR